MLYQNVTNIGLNYEDGFDEIKNLRKLARLVQEWHFQLMPKYSFNYFMDRCHKLGTKPAVRVFFICYSRAICPDLEISIKEKWIGTSLKKSKMDNNSNK